jgi:asparagine synthase (glutamine-hydrolysing)
MSAIAGIVGQGSIDEVRQMIARMSYRRPNQRVWSPAANVYFGEVGFDVGGDDQETIASTTPASRLVRSGSGSEKLADGLKRDLVGCLRSLRDDFALAAVSDRSGRSVVLAADQMAYRSIYVMRLKGRWVFATEVKALLALADCAATVNRDALQYYLRIDRTPREESLLAGARRLVRGQVLRLEDGECSIESYFDPAAIESVGSRRCSARTIREKLEAIVIRQLTGRARVAVTLSAGFDSTSLVALVRHVRPDIQIASYTIGYGADDPEILGARRTAEYFKTEHHESFLSNSELETLLPRYVWLTEDLTGRGEAILQQKIAGTVAEKDRLVMAGHCADSLFAGMPKHRLLWIADRSPPPIRSALRELFLYTQIRVVPKSWLGRRLVKMAQGEEPSEGLRVIGAQTPVWSRQMATLDGYRADMWYAHTFRYHEPAEDGAGLSMLLPFADPELRDLGLRLPGSSLVSIRQQKRILRESMADLLPEFLLRRPKAIQGLRQGYDLFNTLKRLAESLDLDRSLADRGLIEQGVANSFIRGRDGRYTKAALKDLWGLICTELWMRTFCDQRGAAPVDLAKR